jgi:hypothetical protein
MRFLSSGEPSWTDSTVVLVVHALADSPLHPVHLRAPSAAVARRRGRPIGCIDTKPRAKPGFGIKFRRRYTSPGRPRGSKDAGPRKPRAPPHTTGSLEPGFTGLIQPRLSAATVPIESGLGEKSGAAIASHASLSRNLAPTAAARGAQCGIETPQWFALSVEVRFALHGAALDIVAITSALDFVPFHAPWFMVRAECCALQFAVLDASHRIMRFAAWRWAWFRTDAQY